MACVVESLDELWKCLSNKENPLTAVGYIANILSYFEEELSNNEIDTALQAVFDCKSGITPLLSKAFPMKTYKNAVSEAFSFFKYLAHYYKKYLSPFVSNIKDICLSCLSRFDTSAIEKEKACEVIHELLLNGSWSEELNVNELSKVLLNKTSGSKIYNLTPRVLQKLYVILGLLARFYPEHFTNHSDVVFKLLRSELDKQKNKGEMSIIIGCLEGLTEYLYTFSQPLEDVEQNRKEIYYFIKFYINYDSDRNIIQRTALKLMQLHSYLFQYYLYKDYLWWHKELTNKWLLMNNSDDQNRGREALQALYGTVSSMIIEDNIAENAKLVLKYFIDYFKQSIVSSSVYDREGAIEGLGKFSQSCLKYMTEDNIKSLFTLLMQQAEQLYLAVDKINESNRKILQTFPFYVKSIANIIIHLEQGILEISSLQHMAIKLIEMYSITPIRFRSSIVDSLITLVYSLSLRQELIFNEFISVIMYQGLIRICSMEHNEDLVSLWNSLMDIHCYDISGATLGIKQGIVNKLYDMLIKTIMRLISRLDLRVFSKPDNMLMNQEDPNLGLEAKNPSDFKVFIQLIDFFILWLPKTDSKYFKRWIDSFTHFVLIELSRNPLVSGFFKLLTVCFQICERISYFDDEDDGVSNRSKPIYHMICRALQEMMINLKNQKGDLQVSCIFLLLETPTRFFSAIQHHCVEIFQTAFRVGRYYLKLASAALVVLNKWKYRLSAEEIKMIIPELDPYLKNKGLEFVSDKELEQLQNQSQRSRKRFSLSRKKPIELPETELLQLQQNILHFLGSLDYSVSIALLDNCENQPLSWGNSKKLKFKIPFKDMNIFIYLDTLLPNVVDLALSCTERHTRITACELFHSIIIFMLGTCKQMEGVEQNKMSELFEKIFLPTLQLGCDSDDVVCQLFKPLVLQLAHWYSSPFQLRSKNTEIFVNTILNGVAHPSDASLRDISAKCLHEFVEWSIKQHTSGKFEKSSFNIHIIVKRICMLSSHPSASKRLGGALAFNSIYKVLREDENVIDELFLELLYFMVKNLALSKPNMVTGVKNEAELAVDHILRVLKERAHVFNISSKRRKKPPEFDGDRLIDAVKWLLQQCNTEHKNCRRKCMEMIYILSPCVKDCDSFETFISNYVSEGSIENLLKVVEGNVLRCDGHPLSFTVSDIEKSPTHVMLWLQYIASVLDFYIWLIDKSSVGLILLTQPESQLIQSLKFYINMCTRPHLHLDLLMLKFELTSEEIELYNQAKTTVATCIFEFFSDVMKQSEKSSVFHYISENIFDSSLWELLIKCTYESSSFGFDARNDESKCVLSSSLKSFLLRSQISLKEHSSLQSMIQTLMLKFNSHASSFKYELQQALIDCNIPQSLKSALNGMTLLQECELYQAEEPEKDELQNSLIKIIFESIICITSFSRRVVILEPSAQAFGGNVLQFACTREKQIQVLINFLLDKTILCSETSTQSQHGEHFQATFREIILMSLLNHVEITLQVLFEKLSSSDSNRIFSLVQQICQYAVECRHSNVLSCENLYKCLLNYWPFMLKWASLSLKNSSVVLDILRSITLCIRGRMGCLETHDAAEWILSLLTGQDSNFRNRVLEFLPYLISSPMQTPDIVKVSIQEFLESFPADVSELTIGSIQYNNFFLTFDKLLKVLKITRSLFIFERIIALTVPYDSHVCNDQVQETLPYFVTRLNSEEQLTAIEFCYSVFIDINQYTPQTRMNCLQNFIIPFLRNCQHDVLVQIFTKHIGDILDLLNAPLSSFRQSQIEHQLVGKIGSWCMVEALFSIISTEKLESLNSISEAAHNHLETGKTLIGHLSNLAYKSRLINLPSGTNEDSNLIELLRKMKCAAYIALVVIVSCTKKELRFFTIFLFKENRTKSEYLWQNIVNCACSYSFPIVWDQIPQQRKFLTGIRQKNPSQVQYLATDTQILVNSTLAEDVTLFDLSTSIYQSPKDISSDKNNCTEVSLEDDDLNRHECMGTICALLKHMTENELYAIPKEIDSSPEALPPWMEEIRRSVMDESIHQNVRIFLTKIILNNAKIFEPYASFWLYPLMQIVVNGCLGFEINYMVMDVIALIITWNDVAKPISNESEKMLANQIVEFLLVNTPSQRRDIFKYNLDIMRTLVEVWKSCFNVPHQKLLDLLSVPSKTDITKGEAGIHLTSIFLVNGIQPWNDLGKQCFFNYLIAYMTPTDKLLCPCSEVVGLSLKYMDPELHGELGEDNTGILNSIKQKVYNMEKSNGQYLHCLHCISRHYPPILDDFMKNIMYFMSKVSGKFKVMCFEMVYVRLDALNESMFVELENTNVQSLLRHGDVDLQQAVLQLLFKMLPKLQIFKQKALLDQCINLSTVRSPTSRISVYNILMWAYEQGILSDDGKSVLLKGLVDSDTDLQELLYNFWSDRKRLSSTMPNRFLNILSAMYSSETEQHFLSYTLLLLLDSRLFNIEYNSNMFQHPLSQCEYKQLDVILSDHKQRASLAPLFSQTISTIGTYRPFMPDFKVKATQVGVGFQPTFDHNSKHFDVIPSTIGSTLMFTMGSETIASSSHTPAFRRTGDLYQESNVSVSFKTRRLMKDSRQVGRIHAAFAARREARRNELLQNRLRNRDNKVSLFRTYRVGDFPDIQIPFSSIIKPLQILSKNSNTVARQLILSIFTSILQELHGEELAIFSAGISEAFQNVMQKTGSSPVLMGSILEMALVCLEKINLKTDIISSVSHESGLCMLGSLVLEEKLIGKKVLQIGPSSSETEDKNNCWLRIAELYQDIEEWDVVHGIFNEKLMCCPAAKLGLKAESEGKWEDAHNYYTDAIKSDDPDNQKDHYYDAFFRCLAHLSDWSKLHQCVLEQIEEDRNNLWTDSWNQQHLLPQLFACEICLLGTGDSSIFLKALDYWMKDPEKSEYLKTHLSEEIAVLYAIKSNFSCNIVKSQIYTRYCYSEFLNDWIYMNSVSFKQRATALRDVHRLSELRVYLDFISPTNKNKIPEYLISLWRASVPTPMSSLLDWDKKINYRKHFLKDLKLEFPDAISDWDNVEVEMQLAMVDSSLAQNNFSVAKKFLKIIKENHSSLPLKHSLQWILGHSKCLWLRASQSSRSRDKLPRMIKAISILNENDPCSSEIWNEDWLVHLKACELMSSMACGLWRIFQEKPEIYNLLNEESKSHLLQWIGSFGESDSILKAIHNCGLTYLHKATNIALEKEKSLKKTCDTNSPSTVADVFFKMAEYYDKTNEDVIGNKHFLTSVLRAMKYGSKGAHSLFPRLLQMQSLDPEWEENFIQASSEVAEWMFLKWINQILACLDKPVGKVLHDITMRVAQAYPQALTWPYHISREKYKLNNIPLNIVSKLDSILLQNTLVETFLKAMSCVAQPEMILAHHIDEILKGSINRKNTSENLQKACENLKLQIDEISACDPIRGTLFHDMAIYNPQLLQALDLISKMEEKGFEILKQLKFQLEQKAHKRSSQKMLLQKYSPWLSDFQLSYWGDYLELPGQYSGDSRPHLQHLIRIAGFSQEVQIIRSLRLPVKLIIIGNNAKEYPFLVKYGEDLRQDQRIQQLFDVMNAILSKDPACLHRQLNISTYQVVPLTCQIGMIQWIEDTKTLKSMLMEVLNEEEHQNCKKVYDIFITWLKSFSDSEDKVALHRNAYKFSSRQDTVKSFDQRVNLVPWDVFRRAFMHVSKNPEEFFTRRQKFAGSYAVMCISHWVLGIGDRHLENCLIKHSDGSVVGIDFGYAFGCGIQFIPIPELMPFRLTPHIINLMQPFQTTGILQGTMIHCLRALRNNSQVLLATMEVFVHEPSINWIELAQKRYQEQVSEWLPQEKLNIAKKKLEGVNPVMIGSQELESGHGTSKYFPYYLKVLQGDEKCNIRTNAPNELSVLDQVDCLIDLATDPHVLGKTWIGWEPWI